MKRKITILMIVITLLGIVLIGCNKDADAKETKADPIHTDPISTDKDVEDKSSENEQQPEELDEDPYEGMAINPLTGLYIDEEAVTKRPFAVMISNIKAALPQSGIGQADVIYETLAEGGIPRLLALFQNFDAEKIGPVRSARHYFLDFAFDFDAIYVHYGKSPQALQAFSDLNAPNMDGLSGLDLIMCFQDPNRNRPHSTYTSFDGLMDGLDYQGYRQEINEELDAKFNFAEEEINLTSGENATLVELPFSYYHSPWFEYDKDIKMYKRFQYDEKHIDIETGEQLEFKNIIVQIADMWVIPGDSEGRLDMSLVSSGKGYYITNGKYIPITWEKESHYEPTHYYLDNGEELVMNPGKTWISVFPEYQTSEIIF